MLDIRFIRENAERVQKDALNKGYKNADAQAVISLDDERKALTAQIDELRTRRNQIAASMKNSGGKPSDEQIAEGKKIKEELAELEKTYRELDEKFFAPSFYQIIFTFFTNWHIWLKNVWNTI